MTVVDAAGAELSREAEEGGLAGEIARWLAELITVRTATLCILLGQGCGGVALALLPTDRVIAAEHGWLAPLAPEGAAAILHQSTEAATESLGLRSIDLMQNGVVDRVIAEEPDAADKPVGFFARLGRVVEYELYTLVTADLDTRWASRRAKFRRLGW